MAKRSKSRFTDLVKFTPEDEEMQDIESVDSTYEDEISHDVEIFVDDDFNEEEQYEEDENIFVTEEKNTENKTTIKGDDTMKRSDIPYIDEEETVPTRTTQRSVATNRNAINPGKELTESYILGNTTIEGNVITDAGIQIYGAVIGNVESGGRVQLVGRVEGDISGKSVIITETSLTGNINAENEVLIKKGCTVVGDVTAEKIVLNGTVNGNIDAEGQVDFEAGSVLEGNVSAKSFNIKPGAKINGSIGTK